MSAHKSWTIYCDGCDTDTPNPDLGHETVTSARREAKANGFVHRGGTDWCEECQADGTMRAGQAREKVRSRGTR